MAAMDVDLDMGAHSPREASASSTPTRELASPTGSSHGNDIDIDKDQSDSSDDHEVTVLIEQEGRGDGSSSVEAVPAVDEGPKLPFRPVLASSASESAVFFSEPQAMTRASSSSSIPVLDRANSARELSYHVHTRPGLASRQTSNVTGSISDATAAPAAVLAPVASGSSSSVVPETPPEAARRPAALSRSPSARTPSATAAIDRTKAQLEAEDSPGPSSPITRSQCRMHTLLVPGQSAVDECVLSAVATPCPAS